MAHPYRLREIAQQAGLSLATVDRVLHGRPGGRAAFDAAERHVTVADPGHHAVHEPAAFGGDA